MEEEGEEEAALAARAVSFTILWASCTSSSNLNRSCSSSLSLHRLSTSSTRLRRFSRPRAFLLLVFCHLGVCSTKEAFPRTFKACARPSVFRNRVSFTKLASLALRDSPSLLLRRVSSGSLFRAG